MKTDGTVELLTKIDANLSESLISQLSEIKELNRQLCDIGLTLDVYKLSWLKRMKNETP